MSLSSRSPLVPRCTECMRSFAYGYLKEARIALGGLEHVRGKKTKTRGPLTVPVRLLKDMSTFGRAGTIVPVPMGRMRNEWFPRYLAEYLPPKEVRNIKKEKTLIERDFSFLTAKDTPPVEEQEEEIPEEVVQPVFVTGITSQRSMELIDTFVPLELEFYRAVIAEAAPTSTPTATQGIDDAASELLALRAEDVRLAQQAAARLLPKPIYGSVSTQDVLVAIRAAMEVDDEASRVQVEERDISFVVEAEEDAARIKHTGSYEFTINVRGSPEPAQRRLRILAQDAA